MLYFATAWFGLALSYRHSHASPVWPSAGLALGTLLLLGWRVWPGIWLGALAANTIPWIQNEGAPPFTALWVSAAIATGASLEALAGWWLWQRWMGREGQETHCIDGHNVFRFAALALLMCIPSALIGPGAICAAGFSPQGQFPLIWAIWWIGDACAVLLLAPFVIAWAQPLKIRLNLARAVEGIAAFGMLAASIWVIFGLRLPVRPLLFLPLVPLVWIAVRESPRALVSALVVLAVSVIWFTQHQAGIFAYPSLFESSIQHRSILLLLLYLWVVALTCMALASCLSILKKLTNELEERVEARTAELNKTNAALEGECQERARAAEKARCNQERFLLFMENMPGAAFIKDVNSRYIYANEEMSHIRGGEPTEWVGRVDHEMWPKDVADICVANDRRVLQNGRPLRAVETLPRGGEPHEWLIHEFPFLDAHGIAQTVGGIAMDITDLKRAEQRIQAALEREAILRREINHRVKNNLQVISSLLYLQSTKIDDPAMQELLLESQSRVRALALIYDRLCQRGEVNGIAFAEYVEQLAKEVFTAYRVRHETITLKVSAEGVFLDLDTALPCGLILTELISNALKYAFPENRKGEVLIDVRSMNGDRFCMAVCDNGIGLPEGFRLGMAKSMGMQLVRDLTRQLDGEIEFQSVQGTSVRIIFPSPDSRRR